MKKKINLRKAGNGVSIPKEEVKPTRLVTGYSEAPQRDNYREYGVNVSPPGNMANFNMGFGLIPEDGKTIVAPNIGANYDFNNKMSMGMNMQLGSNPRPTLNFRYKFGNGGLAKAGNSAKIEYNPQQYIPDSSDRRTQDTGMLFKEAQMERHKRELETKRKIEEDTIKFKKLSEDLKNVKNPLKGVAPYENKSTFTQDNKNSPYNPLFAPTMVPDYGNSQKGYEASKFVGSQNALDQAFNAAGGLPIGELVGASARFLPEIKGAAGAILETGKELVERVAGKELAKEATHHYVAHENMHSLTPGSQEETSSHEESPKNKFGGKLKVKNKKRWKIID